MRKVYVSLIILISLLASGSAVWAAMEPEEIERINAEAPLHLIGVVVEDELVAQSDKWQQERKMTLEVGTVNKKPADMQVGPMINVLYTYIPVWVQIEGAAKMDIAVGDRIKIRLTQEDGNWMPVLSGSSVDHLHYSENRIEHIEQPFSMALDSYVSSIPHEYPVALVSSAVFLFFLLILFGKRTLENFRK